MQRRLQLTAGPEELEVTVRFGASDSDGAEARPTDRALLTAVVAPLLSQETYPDVSFTLAVKSVLHHALH